MGKPMHEYDVAFRLVLQSVDLTMRELAGTAVVRWLNVELPEVRNARVDLLGETETGELLHLELQSSNDPRTALRMAEFVLGYFANSKNSHGRSWCMWAKLQ
jgi:hypothetical protein